MKEVTVRELRNHGGQVLDRVAAGEALTVTKDGAPVARLLPVPRPALTAATAVANDLPVFTCNPADFAGIDGLTVVSVELPTVRE